MPQEIDGEGSENLPLCRNRVVRRMKSAGLSRNASRGVSFAPGGVAPSNDTTTQ